MRSVRVSAAVIRDGDKILAAERGGGAVDRRDLVLSRGDRKYDRIGYSVFRHRRLETGECSVAVRADISNFGSARNLQWQN